MKLLFAPWRMKFIAGPKPRGCPFCRMAASKEDAKNHILKRGKYSYAVLNLYPYNNGHLMLVPYEHTRDFPRLAPETADELMKELQFWTDRMTRIFKPEGFNIGMNLGRAGGAGIDKHIHFHIVPRWVGDANFMSVCGDTKVMPESLARVYKRLKYVKS
jgi:ATP adenylyltransferase